jgi:hypothetical protein
MHKEYVYYRQMKQEAATRWLQYLRGEGAGNIINPLKYKDESWFDNIEDEHNIVFEKINDLSQKEHEKSAEWLIERYRIYSAFFRHLFVSYPCGNKVLLFLSLIICFYCLHQASINWIFQSADSSWVINNLGYIVGPILALTLGGRLAIIIERLFSLFVSWIILFIDYMKHGWEYSVKKKKFRIAGNNVSGAETGHCFSPDSTIFLSMSSIVQIFMPRALITGVVILFSLREFLTNDDKAREIEGLLSNNIIFSGMWIILLFCCYAFIVTRLVPMLQIQFPKKKTIPILARSVWLLLFLFSFCFVIVLLLDMTSIENGNTKNEITEFINFTMMDEFVKHKAYVRLSFLLALVGATAGIIVEFSTSKTIRSAVE